MIDLILKHCYDLRDDSQGTGLVSANMANNPARAALAHPGYRGEALDRPDPARYDFARDRDRDGDPRNLPYSAGYLVAAGPFAGIPAFPGKVGPARRPRPCGAPQPGRRHHQPDSLLLVLMPCRRCSRRPRGSRVGQAEAPFPSAGDLHGASAIRLDAAATGRRRGHRRHRQPTGSRGHQGIQRPHQVQRVGIHLRRPPGPHRRPYDDDGQPAAGQPR